MRILFLTRKWPPAMGGMETYCEELARRLGARHDLTLHALPGRPDGAAPGALRLLGFGLATAGRLLAGRGGFDVIHGGDMAAWTLVLLARLRAPGAVVALSAHGTDVAYAGRDGLRPAVYRQYLRLGARLLPRARVLANSRATADRAAALGFGDTRVIPLAADVADAGPPPRRPDPVVLFAGRLVTRKGLAWFVDAVLPHLPEGLVLEVAGMVWDESERPALSHPRVVHLGRLGKADLHARMASALCVIVPNIEGPKGEMEGFGLVAAEAAAAGGIVLAARIHGLVEAVIDGETGRLLPPASAPDWIAAIREVAAMSEESRAIATARAMRAARAHYCWDRVARDTEAAYAPA